MLTTCILITPHDYILIKALMTQYRRLHLLRYHIRNLVYDKNFTVFYDRLSGWVYVSFDVCDKVVTMFRHMPVPVTRRKRNEITILSDCFILI